jgi:uncharacterized protein YcgI (DUF1989 family)
MKEYLIESKSGFYIKLEKEHSLKIIDIFGKQVVDLFAVNERIQNEFLSPGVTIDCNESLRIGKSSTLYSNLYNGMFTIVDDSVGVHDLIHPCCRPEMYEFFYNNGLNHPNCFENLNNRIVELGLPAHSIIRPFNLFMNTKIEKNGKIKVLSPTSKPDDYIELKALMNLHVFLAACSVSESDCNGGICTPIKAIVVQ